MIFWVLLLQLDLGAGKKAAVLATLGSGWMTPLGPGGGMAAEELSKPGACSPSPHPVEDGAGAEVGSLVFAPIEHLQPSEDHPW